MPQEVQIALVGNYTKLEDAYASVIKALDHAALAVSHRLKLTYIAAADLEEETKISNPVKYHDAWKILCQCQGDIFLVKTSLTVKNCYLMQRKCRAVT
jgi:CTP synthase